MIPGLSSLLNAGPKSVGGLQGNAHPALTETTGHGALTSTPVVASHLGGSGPFTFAWSVVKGDPSIVITSPTLASTTTTATVGNGDFKQAFLKCIITDSSGSPLVLTTNQITVQFEYS
jgi:hypothetical protein